MGVAALVEMGTGTFVYLLLCKCKSTAHKSVLEYPYHEIPSILRLEIACEEHLYLFSALSSSPCALLSEYTGCLAQPITEQL